MDLLNDNIFQTISVSSEVRKPVYACVAWRAIGDKYALSMMSKVDWEVKEVMSQHSKYVDYLVNVSIFTLLYRE